MIASLVNGDVSTQILGSVVRRGLAPNSCVVALADSVPHSSDLLGARLGSVNAGASGPLTGFVGGMVVALDGAAADGDSIYLSASTAGRGTNVAPVVAVHLGTAYRTYQVSGVWYAELIVPPEGVS
jgi:hypothetical protein